MAIVAVVALVAGVAGFVVLGGDEAGAEVTLEPATSPGADPFSESMAVVEVAEFPGEVEAVITDARAELSAGDGVLAPAGTEPGLYGGTSDEAACDADRLVAFLDENPDKAAAWAEVQGIGPGDIGEFVGSLTSVVLTVDTWVTNHGFADGEATPRQAVLQAGTAVMVDDRGVPRVKCGCGNPLLEPTGEGTPTSSDDAWDGYDPDQVAVVDPGDATESFTLVDVDTGDTFQQAAGTGGGLTVEKLLNVEVPFICELGTDDVRLVRLVDGVYECPTPEAPSGLNYWIGVVRDGEGDYRERTGDPKAVVGDLTGDGRNEGVMITWAFIGQAGVGASQPALMVFSSEGEHVLTAEPGDLPGRPADVGILDGGIIEIEGREHDFECTACEGPPYTARYRLEGDQLVVADGGTGGSGTPGTATPSSGSVRTAELFSDLAKLRDGPNLGATEIATLRGRDGATMEVLGEHEAGWYRVRIDGTEGWIFGAFVLPPDPDLQVAVTRSGTITLRDQTGTPTGETADPPATALITGAAGDLWEVLTSDGQTRYVAKSEMRIVS